MSDNKKGEHFIKYPVEIIKIPESKHFLTTAPGYIYFYLLSWVYHTAKPVYGNYNAKDQVFMAEQYSRGRLGVLSNYAEMEAETGYSKSTIEVSLAKLEAMKLISKFPQGNLGTYFLLGSVNPVSKVERTYLSELAEQAATPEGRARLAEEFERIFAPKRVASLKVEGLQHPVRSADTRFALSYRSEIVRFGLPSVFNHPSVQTAVAQAVLEVGEQHLPAIVEAAGSAYRQLLDDAEVIQALEGSSEPEVQAVKIALERVQTRLKQVFAAAKRRRELQASA